MRLSILLFSFAFVMACNNSQPATTDTPNSSNPNSKEEPGLDAATQNKVFTEWERIGGEVERISGRISEEVKNWQESLAEMKYPESVTSQLSEVNQKKLELIIQSGAQVSDKFQTLSNEFNSWKPSWDNEQKGFQELKSKVLGDSATDKYQAQLELLQNSLSAHNQRLKDWEKRLNAIKQESVLLYNAVNGIIHG